MTDPAALYSDIHDEIGTVLVGRERIVEHLLMSLLTKGHVLIEGVPGVAKTTIANLFAHAIGLEFSRIQMTPDVLPADITGTDVYREGTGEFETQRGPIFANIVLADEINRATPKTQSALLEAMAEEHVTIAGETHALPVPFMVIATQNPIEMEGVFELPEAQRDRFQFKLTIDFPARSEERQVIRRFDADPDLGPTQVQQIASVEDILTAREIVTDVFVNEAIEEYILDLVAATRDHPDIRYGASPRASLAFLNTSKARAAIHGRDFVVPDDVKALGESILSHRLVLSTDAEVSGVSSGGITSEIMDSVAPPRQVRGSSTEPG